MVEHTSHKIETILLAMKKKLELSVKLFHSEVTETRPLCWNEDGQHIMEQVLSSLHFAVDDDRAGTFAGVFVYGFFLVCMGRTTSLLLRMSCGSEDLET